MINPVVINALRRNALACCIALALIFAASAPAQAPAPPDEREARTEIAERLVAAAQDQLRADLSAPMLRESAALIAAACRLDAVEPRFPCLLAEAKARLRDAPGQIAALSDYRKLVPDDRVAQAELIDLYAGQIQAPEEKLAYLKNLLNKPALAAEVKAHVGAEAAVLLASRSVADAIAMLQTARGFYPLPEVLRLQYELDGKNQPPPRQVEALLAMLRANPCQPRVLQEVARVIASQGLAEPSLTFYAVALDCDKRSGLAAPHSLLVDYVAQLDIAGYPREAEQGVANLLAANPSEADFWFLRLALEKNAAQEITYGPALAHARAAFIDQWSTVNDRILGHSPPDSSSLPPDATSAPDPADAINRLKAQDDPSLRAAFESTLADLAWFEVYFAGQPQAAARWLDAIRTFLPAGDLTVRRIAAWIDLVSGKPREARGGFEAIRDKDVLSELGLFKLAEKESSPELPKIRQRLLSQHLTGPLGVIVWEALAQARDTSATKPASTQPATSPAPVVRNDDATLAAGAPAIRAAMESFPRKNLTLISNPGAFYAIRAEPLDPTCRYSEPMLVRVTLENTGDIDLPIGSDGVIQPGLWFDAQLVGVSGGNFPGVAFDRIGHEMVLRPHASVTQTVRIDQGRLAAALRARPGGLLPVATSVLTNPVTGQAGVVPGSAGLGAQASRMISRVAPILTNDLAKGRFYADLEASSPDDQIRGIQFLDDYIRVLLGQKDDKQAAAVAEDLAREIRRFCVTRSSMVGAWAGYVTATLPNCADAPDVIHRMIVALPWHYRVLGLLAAEALPPDQQKAIASDLAQKDPEPLVKAYAAAIVEHFDVAQTRPATRTAPEESK